MTMTPSHLLQALARTLLLFAVCHASACPENTSLLDPIIQTDLADQDECLVLDVHVGPRYCPKDVPLQESLEFYLKPNLPQMSMTFQDDDMMYKATVDGTYLKLLKCDESGTNCAVIDEGGTKDRDLLRVNHFNRILVSYINGEISVDINMKSKVMGGHMRMTKSPRKSVEVGSSRVGNGRVTFLVPDSAPFYSATLKIVCSSVPPVMTTQPPALMTTQPPALMTTQPPALMTTPAATAPPLSSVSPLQACPMHQVEEDHSLVPVPLNDHLTLAVYPSQPELKLIIANDHLRYEVHVQRETAELLKCKMGQCTVMDEAENDELFIQPKIWSFVKVSLLKEKIVIRINDTKILMTSLESPDLKDLRVSAEAPRKSPSGTIEQYVALVKVNCGEPTTPKPSASGISRDVGIVVGVLVIVLLIIALAIVITTMKKRRQATLPSERAPLENQYQQQN